MLRYSRLRYSFTSQALLTLAFCMSVQCLLAADTPSVPIDWSARTTGQQACIAPTASGSTSANLVISNANVILYTYTLDVKSYQLPSNDAGSIPAVAPAAVMGIPPPPPAPNCPNYETALGTIWNHNHSLFPKDRVSVPLVDTQTALDSDPNVTEVLRDQAACGPNVLDKDLKQAVSTVGDNLRVYQKREQDITNNNNQLNIQFPYSVDNTHYYVFTLVEQTRHNGMVTNATLTWKCGLEDILTLSVGVMGTTLPYRTYVSQSVPNGSSTQTVLAVNGNSGWTPQGLALLNYKLGVLDKGPQPGLAISTGPAFKFGGTPGVSSFGWFAGISVSFWRRLFITPGMHLGQFANFPPGFSNGSVIPANFGQLTPTTRWSGHFAIGITFQTNAFVKSNTSTPTTTSNSSGGAGK